MRNLKKRFSSGFGIIEIVVALGLLSGLILTLGQLSALVSKHSTASRQASAILELRNQFTIITKDINPWLLKLRSSTVTGEIFSACIPDSSAASATYSCPPVDDSIIQNDTQIAKIAGPGMYGSYTPLIDLNGSKIAGTPSAPYYLDSEGRACELEAAKCPLRSTGIFLRSKQATNSEPGKISFVIKIEKNPFFKFEGSPMKPHYLTLSAGSNWQSQSDSGCPSGTIKIGYLTTGEAKCENPNKKCATGSIAVSTDSNGNLVCQTMPTCSADTHAVLNSVNNSITCEKLSPCESGQLFLGYYSGSGSPICSSPNVSCGTNQVQVGLNLSNGNLSAQCKDIPTNCTQANQKLSYDGIAFKCVESINDKVCNVNEVMIGINADGSAKCELATQNAQCPTGQIMYGVNSDGTLKCKQPTVTTTFESVAYGTIPPGSTQIALYSPDPTVTCSLAGVDDDSGRVVASGGLYKCLVWQENGTWYGQAPLNGSLVACKYSCHKAKTEIKF